MGSHLQEYGKSILTDEIRNIRKVGFIENYEKIDNKILVKIVNEIGLFDLNEVTYYLKQKQHVKGDEMKWHADDGIVSRVPENNDYEGTYISHNKMLVYPGNEDRPLYTLIVYGSDYGQDFNGGELVFSDDMRIKPRRGMYVFFDSREIHKLETVKSGRRNSTLIKFYR